MYCSIGKKDIRFTLNIHPFNTYTHTVFQSTLLPQAKKRLPEKIFESAIEKLFSSQHPIAIADNLATRLSYSSW